ncbi:hypothetical protein ACHAXM_010962 [Skeletonema potamos]
MRRSKSNPAKYARNYRKISQRHMTGYTGGGDKEENEKKRLEAILQQSEQTWKRGLAENGHSIDDVDEKLQVGSKSKSNVDEQQSNEQDGDGMLSLLSPELREQFAGMGSDNLVILPSKKKQKPKAKALPPLTPQEIKAAKALYKNTQRKLTQLEQRRKQKDLRKDLYKQLEENTLLPQAPPSCEDINASAERDQVTFAVKNGIDAKDAQSLLLKSSELGKKVTKKQLLKQLRRKEELGIPLTKEEMGILYVKYDAPSNETFPKPEKEMADTDELHSNLHVPVSKKNKKKKSKRKSPEDTAHDERSDALQKKEESLSKKVRSGAPPEETISATELSTKPTEGEANHDTPVNEMPKQTYAQMMFAGLTSLKMRSDTQNAELAAEKAKRQQEEEERAMKLEEEERKNRKVYVPSETVKVCTMHRFDAEVKVNHPAKGSNGAKHRQVQRPEEVEDTRFDLPVSAMEFEIMDAVRSNDCTILCGETGSGKSTQVPQFLYEAGFNSSDEEADQKKRLLIGITQPRRVAAVSTAKRVCYEMGQGNGQVIKSDNLVAYQTRYETAGLGPSTHIKFMTDGILLQEIQSDLLLRKYGAIVIDEAHERNLNTDVLLGLLSVALPLRRKAAEEGSLPPLKLVIMSATLRVEDFTENERLFPDKSRRPALVKVPGRTYPVSIHHSKVTELDDYEKAALDKVCKIHRKLPAGGILCFLTGKQEIVRMVNRLTQKLDPCSREASDKPKSGRYHATTTLASDVEAGDGFRDMDDEEADGDLFQKEVNDYDDFEDIESNGIDDVDVAAIATDDDDKRPRKVRILPLYSMMSAEDQAKVFAPVPEDTRLIVIATNIAETSITIPGISYVVDSGRKKERNYNAGTGIASYDVMWISKAAADQRAGRAGRTGPGHCYRLFSSSVYSRVFDQFAIPEVLTRPLEDIVLAMKAMNVSNVTQFPFPTLPEQCQINAAVRLLANLGCIDISKMEVEGGDGKITALGRAVSQLPLGVRYGKMLLVAAQANVLDYAITLVAVLSEATPFSHHSEKSLIDTAGDGVESDELDEVDRNQAQRAEKERKAKMSSKWQHSGGDVLAAMMAAGAYAFASDRDKTDKLACHRFCEENGLNLVVMQRIAKLRLHLCKLAKARLPYSCGIAAATGTYTNSPPNRAEVCVLQQVIASGLLDNIARRAPPGALPTEFTGISRSAYICGNSKLKEPLYIENNSTMHSSRPEWLCYDSILRKKKNDGTTVAIMQKVTPIDSEWLAELCHGSNLLTLGSPLSTHIPRYIKEKDSIQCAVETKFGSHGWDVPPLFVNMNDILKKDGQSSQTKRSSAVMPDDSFRWFARYLFEGKVFSELSGLLAMLNDEPSIITRRRPSKKVALLVSALSRSGIDSAASLQKHWAEKDNKFLFKELKPWIKKDCVEVAKQNWIVAVNTRVEEWRTSRKW